MSLMGLCVNTMFFVGVCMSFVICLCLLWVEKCERPECGEIVVYCEVFVCLFVCEVSASHIEDDELVGSSLV